MIGFGHIAEPDFYTHFPAMLPRSSRPQAAWGTGDFPSKQYFDIKMRCLRQRRRRRCQSFLRPTALHRLDGLPVKEHTAAVPRKGVETDDFEPLVDFRTVVGDLQCLAIERRALVDP